ncbi:MAG: 2-C-methyl-D-erythritol 4-phosphate cytidylyltransferase [Deltaproteobacteria bacterium CG11_big_fil_rev_8_21_14_0_20_47_16]|nr:MAG: 2-C-methyl-D-erythritol 4-phosphate cytidylyltransferase [Deltaproteobacteria bacterium CG11_big_fil_rev_8_21_14_0_20_47_16]
MSVTAIIPAAGQGTRMGATLPKSLIPIAGVPLVIHTLRRFDAAPSIDEVVIVASRQVMEQLPELLESYGIEKVTTVVLGGKERQDSVRIGFENCDADNCDVVVVHDAARPLVTPEEIDAVVTAARESGAAILGAPLKETIKQVTGETIDKTIDRSLLWGAQTPQAFRYEIFARAVSESVSAEFLGTDEASIVERIGIPVTMVRGSYRNIKVTTQEDADIAAMWLAKEML